MINNVNSFVEDYLRRVRRTYCTGHRESTAVGILGESSLGPARNCFRIPDIAVEWVDCLGFRWVVRKERFYLLAARAVAA